MAFRDVNGELQMSVREDSENERPLPQEAQPRLRNSRDNKQCFSDLRCLKLPEVGEQCLGENLASVFRTPPLGSRNLYLALKRNNRLPLRADIPRGNQFQLAEINLLVSVDDLQPSQCPCSHENMLDKFPILAEYGSLRRIDHSQLQLALQLLSNFIYIKTFEIGSLSPAFHLNVIKVIVRISCCLSLVPYHLTHLVVPSHLDARFSRIRSNFFLITCE